MGYYDLPTSPEQWNSLHAARILANWQQHLRLVPPQPYRPGTDLFTAGQPSREVVLLSQG